MAVRLGFVGTGGIANRHLTCAQAHPDMEIVGTCDVVRALAEAAAAQYGGVPYTDFRAMYDAQQPDAIVICTPPFAHGEIEEEAARRGIHFFVEKPVAISMELAGRVWDAVREHGVIAQVGYMFRLAEPIRQARAMLAKRAVAMVQAHYYMPGMPGKGWWAKQSLGGGQLVEQATHMLDLGRFLAGDVKSVVGRCKQVRDWTPPAGWEPSGGLVGYWPEMDIPDTTALILEYASGAMGTLSCSLVPQVAWDNGFKVVAENAMLTIEGPNVRWQNEDGAYNAQADPSWVNAVLVEFVQAVQGQGTASVPYDEGIKSLAVSLAGYESVRRGGAAVELAELLPAGI
ncbi:MAG: Gfo/Idh/MocA family oxidoreductase [Fimbriimonadaceae bacterium]|nr:Gfo/Idh/MocA family oxidoreductase [Fimbriimonadaceae bacterium]